MIYRVYLRDPQQQVSDKTTTSDRAAALAAFASLVSRTDLDGSPMLAVLNQNGRPVAHHDFRLRPDVVAHDPAKEAADAALQAVFAQYPATALWSKIIGYTQASNYSKSGAGEAAKKAVLAGENIAQAVEKMETDWLGAAQRAVDNS